MQRHEPNEILSNLRLSLNLAGGLVTAVLVLSGVWLLCGSLSRDMTDTSCRLEGLKQLLRDESRLRADHAKLRQQLEIARRQHEALQKRIPEEPHEADFLAQVSHAAGEVGLQITDYRPGVMTARKPCSAMQVELSCEGNYRSICGLLDRLGQLPRHSTIARLEIDAGAVPEKYVAKMGLELYFAGGDSRQLAVRRD